MLSPGLAAGRSSTGAGAGQSPGFGSGQPASETAQGRPSKSPHSDASLGAGLRDTAQTAADAVRQQAARFAGDVGHELSSTGEAQKARGVEAIRSFARAIDSAAEELKPQSPIVARTVHEAARPSTVCPTICPTATSTSSSRQPPSSPAPTRPCSSGDRSHARAGRVIAIDTVPERLALARSAGAETLDFMKDDVYERIQDLTERRGADACIDAVGTEAEATASANSMLDAPAAGSGKSNLVNLASIIATGTEAAVTAVGPNDEEMEKRIGSDLLAGAPIIALDNCVRPLDGVILNQMLIQTQVKVRILGLSQSPTLISDAAVMATGNNLTIAGDLTRRVLVCRLDPKVDKPEERVFENDAVIDAMAGRPALVVAALTVLRAYNVAGRPQPEGVRPLGGFEEWTRMIRDALLWLGCADPVASMDRVRAADPVRVALMEVAAQWQEVIGNDRVTVAEAVALACGQEPWSGSGSAKFAHPEFREALLGVAGRGGVVNTKALGRWLASVKDRIVDGVRFEQHSGRAGVAAWELTKT